MTTATTLAAKIAAASKAVGGSLATDRRNEQQKYDYISADRILSVCGQALADQGVVIFPSITDERIDMIEYQTGRVRYDALVKFVFVIADGTSQMELPFVGRGSDYSVADKACMKAITSGHRYFLSKLLMVGAGNEDGEHESAPEPAPVRATRPQPQPQRPAPAAATPDETKQLVKDANALGALLWPDKWAEVCGSNVSKLTGGRTTHIDDLSADELRRLVDGLSKKQQANGVAVGN